MLILKVQFLVMVFITYLFGGFPEIITDIDSTTINLKEITKQKTVAVITIKPRTVLSVRPNFCASYRILTS